MKFRRLTFSPHPRPLSQQQARGASGAAPPVGAHGVRPGVLHARARTGPCYRFTDAVTLFLPSPVVGRGAGGEGQAFAQRGFIRAGAPLIILLALLALGSQLFGRLATLPSPQVEVSGFSTSLRGRTRGQRHNARLSALALDSQVVKPGAVFSFNRTVNSWSLDQGYVKAPVSFDGELVRAYGGGVCQTSTTLYNAVLLAGLPVVERHPHVFRPHYIAPGRDAAVAYPGIDLRFRNPHSWPLRIRARVSGDRLSITLLGAQAPATSVRIATQILDHTTPVRLTRIAPPQGGHSAHRAYVRSPGTSGFRVVTSRLFVRDGIQVRREHLADDTYPAMNHIVTLDP